MSEKIDVWLGEHYSKEITEMRKEIIDLSREMQEIKERQRKDFAWLVENISDEIKRLTSK